MRRFFKKKGLLFLVVVFLSFCFFFVGTQGVSAANCSSSSDVGSKVCGHTIGRIDKDGIYVCGELGTAPSGAKIYNWKSTGSSCGEGLVCIMMGGQPQCTSGESDPPPAGDCTAAEEGNTTCRADGTIGKCEELGTAPSGAKIYNWKYTSCPTGQVCDTQGGVAQCVAGDLPPGDCTAANKGDTKCKAQEVWRCEELGTTPSGAKVYNWKQNQSCQDGEVCAQETVTTATCKEVDPGDVTPPTPGNGQPGAPKPPVKDLPDVDDPPEISVLWDILNNAVSYMLGFMTIVAVAMVIYGAYMWMGSAGDPDRVKSAQGILTWAILGLLFFSIIFLVFRFVLALFGIEGFTLFEF